MMVFKVRYDRAGGHVHCALFAAARVGTAFARCGNFTVRVDEFDQLRIAMGGVEFQERGNVEQREEAIIR